MEKKYHYPNGYSLLQTILKTNEFLSHPIKFVNKSMDKFGDTYLARVGGNKIIITKNHNFINYILRDNHRNYIRSEITAKRGSQFFGQGLLFSNGENWLKQRRLIQPAFHQNKIRGIYENIQRTISEYLVDFPVGEDVNIHPVMHDISFRVLIKSLFDIELSKNVMSELNQIFKELSIFLIKDVNMPLRKLFYPFTGEEKMHINKAKRLREIILDIIKERKSSKNDFNDILDMLIHSKYKDTGKSMTEEQLIDEVQILILAGHETTGNTLSWLMYNLGQNLSCQHILSTKIDNLTLNQVMGNDYIKACINESMRIFTTSWTSERVAVMDDMFQSYSYPKGTIIIPFFFGVHRDINLWEDAQVYNPERFINDKTLSKSKIYFPFGAGPRMCIGNSFAMAEISYFIYLFFKSFKIKGSSQPPKLIPLLTLSPDKVSLNIQRR